MKKTLSWVAVFVAVLVAGFFVLNNYIYQEKQGEGLPKNFKDVTFSISGEPVTLVNGVAEAYTDLGGASKTVIRYFGNEAVGDIDGDGDEDVSFLVTQETGGSGTFFYLVGAINEGDGYRGTQAMLIGDRVAPQTTEYRDGLVIVNYADRLPNEPMATAPHIGNSLYAKYSTETNDFGEVIQNFEGESNVPQTQTESTIETYTLEEVAQHNSESSCWTAIDGDVYDLTPFIKKHPGGVENIMKICGIDGTSAFSAQHGEGGGPKQQKVLEGLDIGRLK